MIPAEVFAALRIASARDLETGRDVVADGVVVEHPPTALLCRSQPNLLAAVLIYDGHTATITDSIDPPTTEEE